MTTISLRPRPRLGLARATWLLLAAAWLALVALSACATRPPDASTATPFIGTPRPVMIDTDMAADDWLAILYVLQRQDLAVRAITVTGAGEAHCEPGVRHALGLAALAGQPAIPVACGRETPLRGNHVFPDTWRMGVDTLLGLRLPENDSVPASVTAPELILSAVADSPTPLTLLTLGPLTNVAEALAASPDLAGQLQMIYIMGGAVDVPGNLAGSGAAPGNVTAEWNFYVDPYATSVVLQSGAPITLVPLDATNHVPVSLDFFTRLERSLITPEARFVHDVLSAQRDFIQAGGYYFWDPLAAAILADESLAEFELRPLAITETEGTESGALVVAEGGAPIRFAVNADRARFEQSFLDTLNAQWP